MHFRFCICINILISPQFPEGFGSSSEIVLSFFETREVLGDLFSHFIIELGKKIFICGVNR